MRHTCLYVLYKACDSVALVCVCVGLRFVVMCSVTGLSFDLLLLCVSY